MKKQSSSVNTELIAKLARSNIPVIYFSFRTNADSPIKMTVDDPDSMKNAPLIPDVPLKFLFHGYTGHRNYTPNMEIRPGEFPYFENLQIASQAMRTEFHPMQYELNISLLL